VLCTSPDFQRCSFLKDAGDAIRITHSDEGNTEEAGSWPRLERKFGEDRIRCGTAGVCSVLACGSGGATAER